jgi:hypothetical protein
MARYVLSAVLLAAVAAGPFAAPAAALVECQDGDVNCYRQCYLPQIEKGKPIYWNAC